MPNQDLSLAADARSSRVSYSRTATARATPGEPNPAGPDQFAGQLAQAMDAGANAASTGPAARPGTAVPTQEQTAAASLTALLPAGCCDGVPAPSLAGPLAQPADQGHASAAASLPDPATNRGGGDEADAVADADPQPGAMPAGTDVQQPASPLATVPPPMAAATPASAASTPPPGSDPATDADAASDRSTQSVATAVSSKEPPPSASPPLLDAPASSNVTTPPAVDHAVPAPPEGSPAPSATAVDLTAPTSEAASQSAPAAAMKAAVSSQSSALAARADAPSTAPTLRLRQSSVQGGAERAKAEPASAAAKNAPQPTQPAASPESLAIAALLPATPPAPMDARAAAPVAVPQSTPTSAAATPRAPVDQVMPAMMAIAAPDQPGAPQTVTIRLDPAELGHVQVRIERSSEGPTRVELAVERSDTLMLLLRDQPQLHRALDLAGVPPDGRTIHLSLAQPEAAHADPGWSGTGTGSSGAFGGTGSEGGGYRRQNSSAGGGMGDGASQSRARAAWRRAGIDITA